ncbi:MAG: PDZ domain-containing protein [Rubripirellula sp.]
MSSTTNRTATLLALTIAAVLTCCVSASAQGPNITWRFGMNVSLRSNGPEKGLMIQSVAPGSAAQQAGLQPGMVILSANGRNFHQAQNDHHAIAMLQSYVTLGGSGGGVPTTATFNSPAYGGPTVQLVVVRPCGSMMRVLCRPHHVGGGGGGVPTAF